VNVKNKIKVHIKYKIGTKAAHRILAKAAGIISSSISLKLQSIDLYIASIGLPAK